MNLNLLLSDDFNKYAANVTVSGLVIVFAMLILLVVIIALFGKLMSAKAGADKKQIAEKASAPAQVVQKQSVSVPSQDDDELIAVIAAAVDSMYEGSGKKAVIKSVTPCSDNTRSAWAAAGLNNNVRAF